jgi:hypothetical protein
MVLAGYAYMATGLLLPIGLLFTAMLSITFAGWLSNNLLILLPSVMLMIDGFLLVTLATPNIDLVIETAINEAHVVVTDKEKTRLKQMSRSCDSFLFGIVTINALVSFLITDTVQSTLAGVLYDVVLFISYTFLFYGTPLVVIPFLVYLFARNFSEVQPILGVAFEEWRKKLYPRYHDKMKEAKKEGN